jgi:hypothetical protein
MTSLITHFDGLRFPGTIIREYEIPFFDSENHKNMKFPKKICTWIYFFHWGTKIEISIHN